MRDVACNADGGHVLIMLEFHKGSAGLHYPTLVGSIMKKMLINPLNTRNP